jgi:CDP-diacylglycerol--glycerol-3-phosphate 3-phosphatidyltransferase/cardiolipin synthase
MRIAVIPIFVGVLYVPEHYLSQHQVNLISTVFFVLAALTDWLDGYVAREYNQASAFGAFLDPVADKLMVAAALIVLLELGRVNAIIALIIIGREIAISALREWMAGIGQGGSVAVAFIGKLKTILQMVAIPFLLYYEPIFGISIKFIGEILIVIAAFLTLLSMAYYIKSAWPSMRARK